LEFFLLPLLDIEGVIVQVRDADEVALGESAAEERTDDRRAVRIGGVTDEADVEPVAGFVFALFAHRNEFADKAVDRCGNRFDFGPLAPGQAVEHGVRLVGHEDDAAGVGAIDLLRIWHGESSGWMHALYGFARGAAGEFRCARTPLYPLNFPGMTSRIAEAAADGFDLFEEEGGSCTEPGEGASIRHSDPSPRFSLRSKRAPPQGGEGISFDAVEAHGNSRFLLTSSRRPASRPK